ncbi:MAG: BamA/TamA family outer membrane protein, partial [Candidatus Marinimicrobia bacterium]|nr:BamA/TamA family outer membrane protein [Candidatus Neomarinimicrobiota bacterium]
YNNFHHLVGHLRYLGQTKYMPGMRFRTSLEFAGLTHLTIKALYPHGSDGVVFYPFVQAEYVSEPLLLNDLDKTIALYDDLHYNWSFGFGIWPNNATQLQLGIEQEQINIYPEIGMSGLPEWKHELVKMFATFNIDHLDQVLIPSNGWKLTSSFELSSSIIGSDIDYSRLEIMLKSYRQVSKKVNLGVQAYLGEAIGANSVNYLWFHTGGPDSFVGIDYYGLSWYRVANFRFDLRYELDNDLYLKAIYNIAPNFTWRHAEKFYPLKDNAIQGFGVGLLYDSALGPIELIYSSGDNELDVEKHFQSRYLYLTAGVNF